MTFLRRRILSCSILWAVALPMAAQQPDSVVTLPSVVVTANRRATARDAVPSTVTVLDGTDLRARGIRFVSEALRDVPGLSIVQTGSLGSQTSLFVRGGESDHVKVLIDGVPLNEPGGTVDLAYLTTDNVDRIEVVRGPASVLYGSDAISGVVHIVSSRGSGDARASVGMTGGTFGAVDADVGVQGGTQAVSYSAGVSQSVTDGILPFNNQFRNVVGSGTIEVRPDDRTVARLSVRYTDGLFHFPTDGNGNVVDRNAFRADERTVTSLEVGRYLSPAIELIGLLSLNQSDATNDDQPDDTADTLGFFQSRGLQAMTRRGADVRMNAYLPRGVVITAGLSLEEQEERRLSTSTSEFGTSSSVSAADRRNWAPFVQVHAQPTAALALTTGVRLDANSAFGEFVTGRGGASLHLSAGTRIRASVGSAFKEPTFFENFSNSAFATGNPNLVPERTESWEAGVEQSLMSTRVWVSATYFAQRFRDLIQYTFVPPNPGDPNYFNVAEANASGAEVELRAVPVLGLHVATGYTWTKTRVVNAGLDTDGLQFVTNAALLRRPEHQAFARVQYRVARGHLSAQLQWTDERSDRDFSAFPAEPVVLPAYTTMDVATRLVLVRRREGRPEIALQSRVSNVFGETYQSVFGFSAPGRTIMAGGSVSY